ncbi:MAG: hypothetical protein ACK5MT_02885 [Actinomycetales bacterium]
MRLAGEVYEAEIVPREHHSGHSRSWPVWLSRWTGGRSDEPAVAPVGVVADIVVIDLRNGAERVEISVTGAQIASTLALVHRDLDSLSVESFDEAWGVI